MLVPVTDRDDAAAAYATLAENLKRDTISAPSNFGHQGGGGAVMSYWSPQNGYWVAFIEDYSSRYWIAYGRSHPSGESSLTITLEINPPKSGDSQTVAGKFLLDTDTGQTYYAHSGKIGGGRPKVSGRGFVEWYSGTVPRRNVNWGRPVRESRMFVLGRVDDPNLGVTLASYLKDVAEFKTLVTTDAPPVPGEKDTLLRVLRKPSHLRYSVRRRRQT